MRIGVNIDQAKGIFFDRQKVQNPADKAKRRVLARFGAFVRTTARRSIRKRKGTSEPGRPPHSHTGLLRRFIFFGYDEGSVLIGPAKLNSKRGNAPEILEEGGRIKTGPYRGEDIEPRPYMGPAFTQELDANMPAMWRNSIS